MRDAGDEDAIKPKQLHSVVEVNPLLRFLGLGAEGDRMLQPRNQLKRIVLSDEGPRLLPTLTHPMKQHRKAQALPALWAIRRALDLCGLGHQHDQAEQVASGSRVLRAFACYIEEHEQPPLDPLASEARIQAARASKKEGLMGKSLKMVLLVLGMAVIGGLAALGLRGMFSTPTTEVVCDEPLPASMRLLDCNTSGLTALFTDSLERADDGRVRAAVMVVRKPGDTAGPEVLKHYAIVDVDCASLTASDVLLVKTFTMDNQEDETPQAFENFLDYWYPPEPNKPARFHSVLNQVACEKI